MQNMDAVLLTLTSRTWTVFILLYSLYWFAVYNIYNMEHLKPSFYLTYRSLYAAFNIARLIVHCLIQCYYALVN